MSPGLDSLAKTLVAVGAVLIVLGGMLSLAARLPFLGRLPGDIYIRRDNFRFYFPITTSIVISILLSLLIHWLKRR